MSDLNKSPQLFRLAADLGLRPERDPVRAIRDFSLRRLRRILKRAPLPNPSLSDLLAIAQEDLGTFFIEIRTDQELADVQGEYGSRGEVGFATLQDELSPEVFAVTFRLTAPRPGERPFVSIIDCRGAKASRAYFSKWHELAHLLTLTPQSQLRFCRTHFEPGLEDPEERLMEKIAGDSGFLSDLIVPQLAGHLDFTNVSGLRKALCPAASEISFLIGVVEAWPTPALLLRAQYGLKASQQRQLAQVAFDFLDRPSLALRAVESRGNEKAAAGSLRIPRNMRIPAQSVIATVMRDGGSSSAIEDLSWWETEGRPLGPLPVLVSAKRSGDSVQGLITPYIPEGVRRKSPKPRSPSS